MVFENFLWGKGRAKDNKFLKELHGHTVDLKRKKNEGKSQYYSCASTSFNASFSLPVDLQDLQSIKLVIPKQEDSSKERIRQLQVREGWLDTPLGRFKLLEWQLKDLIAKYPKTCRKCGYSRFQYLEVEHGSMTTRARYYCPYCGKKTEVGWKD